MIITAIKLHNFGVYKGEHTICPSINSDCPITLVGGMNGGGKTSILEAIFLSFYGKRSPRVSKKGINYSEYLRQLVHRGETECSVEVQFDMLETNNKVNLRLQRSWSINGNGLRISDRLQVWKDVQQNQYLAENWDSYIEDLLPAAIAELFFFDAEQISVLAESDNTLEPLSRAIRSLLGVEVVDRLIRDLSTVMNRNKRMNQGTTQSPTDELTHFLNQSEQLRVKLDVMSQGKASLNNKLIRERRLLRELDDQFYGFGGDVAENRKKLEEHHQALQEQLQRYRTSIGILTSGALPLALVRVMLRQVLHTVENEMDVVRARMTLPVMEAVLEDVGSLSQTDTIAERLHQHLQELQTTASRNTHLSSPMTVDGILKRLVQSAVQEEQHEAQEVLAAYELLLVEEEQIERELQREVDLNEVQRLVEERRECGEHIRTLEKETTQLEHAMAETKIEQQRTDQEVTNLGMMIAKGEDHDRIIQFAARTQEIMRTFRKRLTHQKIESLTDNITKAFNFLTHKTTLVSKVDVDADTLRISLIGYDEQEIAKFSLSSGERQMLAVSILWGLAQTTGRMLPIIIDTPMGRLDSEHRIRFVKEYLPHASHQVIVLSTDTELNQHYLSEIEACVGQRYYLHYSNDERRTVITEGYFPSLKAVRVE